MGLLGISWFRTRKEKELKEQEQSLKNELLQAQIEVVRTQSQNRTQIVEESIKLYKKVKFVNNVLTVVLNDGSIISKTEATESDFRGVRDAKTEREITDLILAEERELPKEENVRNDKAAASFDFLLSSGHFESNEGSLYLKGVKRSIPALLINAFNDTLMSGNDLFFESLKKFWLKCCLNPNAQSAEDLFTFLNKHHFSLDKHGNFYAYRRVVSRDTANRDLVAFVSNTYTKVKSIWKKKPSNYTVYESDGSYSISEVGHVNDLGNLEQLYLDLPSLQEKTYTSKHTGLEDYRVGSIISMSRDKGDDNNSVSCSKGFHAASKEYNYSGFGDTPILVIINPMDVLAVPKGEDGKLRTSRWFFASILAEEEQHILDNVDFDVTELGDRFEELCAENLEEYVKNGFAEEVKRHTFTLSNISSREIHSIINTLDRMRKTIEERVVVWDYPNEEEE